MAFLTGLVSKLQGSAGNLTFRHKAGKTIVAEKITQTTDARTDLQVKQRMKWANVVRMYQVLRPYMKLAFGGTQNRRSDYNQFVSVNVALKPIFLSKAEVSAGACIVAPYQVTKGRLNSIVVEGQGNKAVTDIALGSLTINDQTTVAQFSNAVVQNNKEYSYGDQITYFLVTQHINAVTSTPIAGVDACCIVLDKASDAKLLTLVDSRGFSVQGNCLAANSSALFGDHGMVWIHSRKSSTDGSTSVSTQYLIIENSLLTTYQSDDAFSVAVKSYGGIKSVYLTPSGTLTPSTGSGSGSSSGSTGSTGGSDNSGSGSSGSGGSGNTGGGSGSELPDYE